MAYQLDEAGKLFWEPNKRQQIFLSAPDEINELLYGGAASGGKTQALLMYPIVKQWHTNPYFHGIIFRRTFPQVKEALVEESKRLFEPLGAIYNESHYFWRFPKGGILRFGSLEYEKDVFKHQSAEFSYIAFDELTHFTEFQYRYMLSRLRAPGYAGLPCVIRSGSNPGNIGHAWVRRRFVEPFRLGGRVIEASDDKGNTRRLMYVIARVEDNPHVSEQYKQELDQLPEADRRALKEGDWWSYSGSVFTEFRTYTCPDEPPNALHVIDPVKIPAWWPKLLTVDWGYDAWAYMLWGAISPDLRLYLYREYAVKKTALAIYAAEAARLSQFDGLLKYVIIDPSAKKHDVSEESILDQWIRHSGFVQTETGDNDRVGGKQLIHEFLRWRPRGPRKLVEEFDAKRYDDIYRISGEAAAKEYLLYFKQDPPELNLPRLQIFSTLPKLIESIQACTYKDASKDGKRPEDVKEFDGDDPYDCLRYKLKKVDSLQRETLKIAKRETELAAILDDYQKDQDYASFNMRMKHHEHRVQADSKPAYGPTLYGRRGFSIVSRPTYR